MRKLLVIIFIQMALLIIPVSSQGEMMRKPMAIETPTVGGASASFTCGDGKCRCKGVEDCEDMVDSGQCVGDKYSCDDNGCSCDYIDPVPLNKSPNRFKGYQQ